jgi:cytochrome c-type biogenesis protein CcmH/NrfG/tRNA A-37 threonylcarbamoyl transferase component Bud32
MIGPLNDALGDRYRVEQLVGRGGMATVYRAVDLRHERIVAIKVMNPDFAATVGRDRFLREIRVTASLSHPHILALYDSGDANGLLYYVMPFIEGISLRHRLTAQPRLDLDEVRKIAREVAEALSYAARHGIVHRDVKPENILLAGYSPGETRASWNTLLADFGIAAPTFTRGEHFTGTGIAVGSPQYMSPEQAIGDQVDQRTDIWSLGCVVYEMLEGAPPRGVPSFKTAGAIPPSLPRAVLRALAADPADRFADARDFADAIDDRTRKSMTQWVRPLFWAGAAAAVALAAASSTMWRRPATRGPRLTQDSLAFTLYRHGRANLATRNAAGVAEAFSQFSRAIERDSGFALAWSGLARTAQMALLFGFTIPGASPDSLLALALNASRRGVTLDSSATDVWVARARVMESVEPTSRTGVINDLKRALAADSTNGEAWFLLGRAREDLLDSAGARVAYERAVALAPTNVEALAFFALHYHGAGSPANGLKWADSALAIEPTYELARAAALLLSIEARDWRLAERHLLALNSVVQGRGRVAPLSHAARIAALKGDRAGSRRLALTAERLVDSTSLTRHEAVWLGHAFSSAGDTARAYRWLAAFSPRDDVHFQLHLHRDPALAWVRDPRYRRLLSSP